MQLHTRKFSANDCRSFKRGKIALNCEENNSLTPVTPALLMHLGSIEGSFNDSTSLTASSSKFAKTAKRPIIPALNVNNSLSPTFDEVTIKLAEKSNYQHIVEGTSKQLGLEFDPAVKNGFSRRKANHKVAEKRRRDDIRHWFDVLKSALCLDEDISNNNKQDCGPQRKVILQKGMKFNN